MNYEITSYISYLISHDRVEDFYKTKWWRHLRYYVLKELDHFECYDCNKKGILEKARYVHHVNAVKEHPELALSIYFINKEGKKERNLISLCFNCHEIREGRCYSQKKKENKFINEEWW